MTPRRVIALSLLLLFSGLACGPRTSVATTPDTVALAALQAGKTKIKFVRIVPAPPVPK